MSTPFEAPELNPKFSQFVAKVSPKYVPTAGADWQKILQILWEIFQAIAKMGWFQAWLTTWRVKSAMHSGSVTDKLNALHLVRSRL